MKVYRLCDENEVQDILSRHTLQDIGNLFKSDCKKNTHNYEETIKIYFNG